jgi:hypothetical protein
MGERLDDFAFSCAERLVCRRRSLGAATLMALMLRGDRLRLFPAAERPNLRRRLWRGECCNASCGQAHGATIRLHAAPFATTLR